ncbi:MAG: deoxyribonuclease V [Bacteroidetes bacterium]|nr:deoxyribonuclease V [Bacteroidota bacterium]MCL5026313.1 deoxyribonuclease V [Chloroflexota bacterium]
MRALDPALLHRWDVTPLEAIAIQNELRGRVSTVSSLGDVRWVAGVDVGVRGSESIAAVALLHYPDLSVAEVSRARRPVTFPYIPGLLSFRELPAVLSAFQGLQQTPDLVLVDGQGLAHPRRFGIACHLGVLLDLPTIGCAKSRLYGREDPLDEEAGSTAYLRDGREIIGALVRTKRGSKPVYVSIGHKVDLPTAISYTLSCTGRYRLPEPTRQAHLAAR